MADGILDRIIFAGGFAPNVVADGEDISFGDLNPGPTGRAVRWTNLTGQNRPAMDFMPDGNAGDPITTLPTDAGWLSWTSTYEADYAGGITFGGFISLTGLFIQHQNGFAFNNGLIFAHGTNYRNDSASAANFGSFFTLVDQPLIEADTTARTGVIQNSVRAQPRFSRINGGTLTWTNSTLYECAPQVLTGATVTTMRAFRAAVGTVTGTIVTWIGLDIPAITAATNITGISCGIAAAATRRFIEHTGTAISTFAGIVHMNDGVAMQFGTPTSAGVQLLRSGVSTLRMIGITGAGALQEGLDLQFSTTNNVRITSSTGASLNIDTIEVAFGPGVTADGTNNWVFAFAPGLRATQLAGDYAEVLFTSSAAINVVHAITTFATWTINAPTIVIGGGSIVDAANVVIQTSMGQGTNRYGLLVTSNPSGGTLNYCARFTGATGVRIDGILEHTGSTLGFYGSAPVVRQTYTPTNVTTSRSFDADTVTLAQLADIVGTMIADEQAQGLKA